MKRRSIKRKREEVKAEWINQDVRGGNVPRGFCVVGGTWPFFPPSATPFYRLTLLYIPRSPIPLLFFGFLFNYSYVPLIPYRLNLSFQLKALSEFFSASRYLSGALASQRLSPTILTLYGI